MEVLSRHDQFRRAAGDGGEGKEVALGGDRDGQKDVLGLMIYHGVRNTAAGALYRLGLALFDTAHPDQCLLRGDEWIFGPETPYECNGDVGHVAFPCGVTVGADGDTLNLYYGAADTSIALATGSIGEMLQWLDEHGSPEV